MTSCLLFPGALAAGPAVTEWPASSTTVVPPATGCTCWSKVSTSRWGAVGTSVPDAGLVSSRVAWAPAEAGQISAAASAAVALVHRMRPRTRNLQTVDERGQAVTGGDRPSG